MGLGWGVRRAVGRLPVASSRRYAVFLLRFVPLADGWSLATNRLIRAVVAGLEHGVVSRREEVVDFLAVHIPGGERARQVNGVAGGLDQRDMSW